MTGKSGPLRRDVAVDHALEQSQRHIAAEHDGVVERPQVEARAERGPGFVAKAVDLAVADLVAAGLARPGAIAVDLALHFLNGGAVGAGEPLDRLGPRPSFGV